MASTLSSLERSGVLYAKVFQSLVLAILVVALGCSSSDVDESSWRFAEGPGAERDTRADFTQLNLRFANHLATANLDEVVWDRTTCPDGNNSDALGGSCPF